MGRFTRADSGTSRGLKTSVRSRRTVLTRTRNDPLPPVLDGPPAFSFLVHGTGNPVPTLLTLNPFRRTRGDEVLVVEGEGDAVTAPLVDHVVPDAGAGTVELARHAWGRVLVFVPVGTMAPNDLAELLTRAAAQASWGFFRRQPTTSWAWPGLFWNNHLAPRPAHWFDSRVWFLHRDGVARWSRHDSPGSRELRRLLGPPAYIAAGVEGG